MSLITGHFKSVHEEHLGIVLNFFKDISLMIKISSSKLVKSINGKSNRTFPSESWDISIKTLLIEWRKEISFNCEYLDRCAYLHQSFLKSLFQDAWLRNKDVNTDFWATPSASAGYDWFRRIDQIPSIIDSQPSDLSLFVAYYFL